MSTKNFPTSIADLTLKHTSITLEYDVQWRIKLGTGVSGPVRPCTRKSDGKRFALKCLVDSSRSRQEAQIHCQCRHHPNIVAVEEVFLNRIQFPTDKEPKVRLLLVLELMEGGELFDRISKEQSFTEKKAAMYMKQIANAVHHLHSKNIAHRDLKPENLLLTDATENAILKLSDFGFAKFDDGNLSTPHFTPYYVAPQILEAQKRKQMESQNPVALADSYTYDKKCDMWSLGVILYIMLCGYPPFYSETPTHVITLEMKKKIMTGDYEFPEEDWTSISDLAKDIVRRLLHVDPAKRMTVQELLDHEWFVKAGDITLRSPTVVADKASFEDIQLAHAQQLTLLRLDEKNVTLKPLEAADNPMMRKRMLRNESLEDSSSEPPAKIPPDSLSAQAMSQENTRHKPDDMASLIYAHGSAHGKIWHLTHECIMHFLFKP